MEKLFEILRYAFWGGEPVKVDAEEIDGLIELAERQTVAGVVADVIMRCNEYSWEESKTVRRMVSIINQISATNDQVEIELLRMVKFLSKRQMSFVVMKGQTIGTLYPNPKLRESGDVDFYMAQKDEEKIIDILSSKTTIEKERNSKHFNFESAGVCFELHTRVASFPEKNVQAYFDDIIEQEVAGQTEKVVINGVEVPTLSPTVNAVYLFVHIFHHFMGDGIGLRQLCDWMLMLHKNKDEIDRQRLGEILDKIGYRKAFCAFGCILTEKLGLKEENFPLPITDKDRKWLGKLLKDISKGGNFGKYKRTVTESGWKHGFESAGMAFRQYAKFFSLTPKNNIIWAWHTLKLIPEVAWSKLKGEKVYSKKVKLGPTNANN